jgi:UDPglucose 6-dehydrogenase
VKNNLKVAFLGLSHLGIVSSLSVAAKGFDVLAVDTDKELIDNLKKGKYPINEPELEIYARDNVKSITYSTDLSRISACEVIYISRDIPTDDFGNTDLTSVHELIDLAITQMNNDAILVILCQVPLGFTREISQRHKKVFYQVETLVFGEAFSRASRPERIIIGKANRQESIPKKLQLLLEEYGCPILDMTFESAELSKMAINAFLASSVSMTNELNSISNKFAASWSDIKLALKLDKRIGEFAYLTPGLGISGGNIERDLRALSHIAMNNGSDINFFETILELSKVQKDWVNNLVDKEILNAKNNLRISILGLAYKANTNSIKNSPAIDLLRKFRRNIAIVYDPQVKLSEEFIDVVSGTTALDTFLNVDMVLIMTPWKEFSDLDFGSISGDINRKLIIIDPFGVLMNIKLPRNFELKQL